MLFIKNKSIAAVNTTTLGQKFAKVVVNATLLPVLSKVADFSKATHLAHYFCSFFK